MRECVNGGSCRFFRLDRVRKRVEDINHLLVGLPSVTK